MMKKGLVRPEEGASRNVSPDLELLHQLSLAQILASVGRVSLLSTLTFITYDRLNKPDHRTSNPFVFNINLIDFIEYKFLCKLRHFERAFRVFTGE